MVKSIIMFEKTKVIDPRSNKELKHKMINEPTLHKLPKSAKKILILLAEAGTITQKEIISLSAIPAKTVRYALKRLGEANLIATRPNLADMRSSFYSLNDEIDFHLMGRYIDEANTAVA